MMYGSSHAFGIGTAPSEAFPSLRNWNPENLQCFIWRSNKFTLKLDHLINALRETNIN